MAVYKFHALTGGDWTIQKDSENTIEGASTADATASVESGKVRILTFYPYYDVLIDLATDHVEVDDVNVTASGAAAIAAQINADVFTGGGGAAASYTVYTALLSQTGTDAPVATVLENTLGITPVWSYDDVGMYILTGTGIFIEDKTFYTITNTHSGNSQYLMYVLTSPNTLYLETSTGGVAGNGKLTKTPIEIRVYP